MKLYSLKIDSTTYQMSPFSLSTHVIDKGICNTHYHDYFEIELITKGEGSVLINNVTHHINQGVIYLLNPTSLHMIIADKPLEILNIAVSPQLINEELLNVIYDNNYITDKESVFKNCSFIFDILKQDYNNCNECVSMVSKNAINLIISLLSKETVNKKVNDVPKDFLLTTIEFISNNYKSNITLQELSNSSGYQKNYLCRKFKNFTGYSVFDYINNLRLTYAEHLLISTTMPISSICFNCGFSSISRFNKSFKFKNKITPQQYRKSHIKHS